VTALCPSSGPSAANAGLQDNLVVAGGLADILAAIPQLAFLGPVAALLGVGAYFLPSFCATDPPGFPTFTNAEVTAFTSNNLGADYASFLNKAKNAIATAVWYQSCHCTTGATPALPTPPAAPSGGISVTGPPPALSNTPCLTAGPAAVHEDTGFNPITTAPLPSPTFFSGPYYTFGYRFAGFPEEFWGVPLPGGATSIVVTTTMVPAGGTPGGPWTWRFAQAGQFPPSIAYDPQTVREMGNTIWSQPSSTSQVVTTIPVLAGADQFEMEVSIGSSTTYGANALVQVYCGGTPGQAAGVCCPPDQSLLLLLNQINTTVTLLQRQIAPFAYITSTVHAGLSGNGQFSVQGILGLAVSITTLPSRVGAEAGDPLNYYGVGWINVGTADGWGPREWITSNPFILKPVSGDVTLVGYSIPSDVTITITELVREP
jgi:hypothetical protein